MNHGTLLGLVRGGKPIENDNDIDIGIWADDEALFCQKIAPAMQDMGYRMTVFSYREMNFMYKFRKQNNSQPISVDFHLMRMAGDYAWRPQPGPLDNPYHGIAGWAFHCVRGLLGRYADRYSSFSSHVDLTSCHLRFCASVGTCWTPAHFFKYLIKLDKWDCHIPRDWNEYLTFKYGDWRTPHEGPWDFWTMEGGLIHKDPPRLIEEMQQEEKA